MKLPPHFKWWLVGALAVIATLGVAIGWATRTTSPEPGFVNGFDPLLHSRIP